MQALWDKMTKNGTSGTLKPVKKHATLKRHTLSALSKRTLGAGVTDVINAIKLPPGEELNEWVACHIVDFFNELSVLYGSVSAAAMEKFPNEGDGFPPGFEYRWAQPGQKAMRVSGPEYIDYVMSWIEANLDTPTIFPAEEDQTWPAEFMTYAEDMFRRMFRIFAILFHRLFDELQKIDAHTHLNTVFRHFMFFSFEYNLVGDKETGALAGPVNVLHQEYEKANKA
jgi:MOB kinase activator 1